MAADKLKLFLFQKQKQRMTKGIGILSQAWALNFLVAVNPQPSIVDVNKGIDEIIVSCSNMPYLE
jgi:hypothetical protein